jgi:predicted Zn-dependent peptidase
MTRELLHGARRRALVLAGVLALLLGAGLALAQDLESFEKKTAVHVLDNGWTFIIVERPVAPVFSFATYANVGAAQEVPGITGLAHMFEHMAFKGTPNIGTTNYKAEKRALQEMEAAYQAWQRERLSLNPDQEKLAQLEAAFREKQEKAGEYVIKDEFGDIVNREGGAGMNASTSQDFTRYYYSLPANKVELMAYLESERFLHPVFREFYIERDVVMEERRWRIESQPIGRLIEQAVASAYVAHPYKHSAIGHMSDLQSITMSDAEEFFRTYYVPSNLVTAIVGDVKAKEIIPVLERYFARIPVGPQPPGLRTVEPAQIGEKTVILKDPSQPFYAEGYHKPAITDADQPVYDAIDDILSNGRTSRLYRSLVRDKKIAVAAQSFSGYPGVKYPGLWIALALPAPGHSNEETRDAIREELERLKTEDVTDEELQRFKTRAKADLVRSLRSNTGLAENLAEWHTLFGDWRELFRYIERIDGVTKGDIRRVASETFKDSNRTVGMIVTETAEAAGGQS